MKYMKCIYKQTNLRKQSLLAAGTVLSGALTFISLLLLMIPEWLKYTLIIIGGLFTVFIVVLFFYVTEAHNYSLRYLWLGKKYKSQTKEVLTHFGSCDAEFHKELIKDCKRTYRTFGNVLQFNERDDIDKEIFREDEKVNLIRNMADDLLTCIDNGTGWEGFIGGCDEGRYKNCRREACGEASENSLEGWEVRYLLSSGVFTNVWCYLTDKVYDICDFTLKDTHISPEYTKECEKVRKQLADSYSPSLATFRNELEALSRKISEASAKEKK